MWYNLQCLDEQIAGALLSNEAADLGVSQSHSIVGKAPSVYGLRSSAVRLGNGSAYMEGVLSTEEQDQVVRQLKNGRWQGYPCSRCGEERTYSTRQRARESAETMCRPCYYGSAELRAHVNRRGPGQIIDIAGKRFGKLLAVSLSERKKGSRGEAYWNCVCDCGKECVKSGVALRGGKVLSCGCLRTHPPKGYGEGAFNQILVRYKRNARDRGYEWMIDEAQFAYLISQPCVYCGGATDNCEQSKYGGEFYYTGIDRVSNDEGYHPGNVVPCCKKCNWAKGEMAVHEFAEWVATVSGHQDEGGAIYQRWVVLLSSHEQALSKVKARR